jgi:hypothetical protein
MYAQSPIPPTLPDHRNIGRRTHRGGLILGLGIVSLGAWFVGIFAAFLMPCCGTIGLVSLGLAIPAWIMANTDLAAMAAGTMDPSGRDTTQAGKVCAIIAAILQTVSLLIVVLLILAVFGVAAASGGLP